jgi:hypothetical protein
MSYGVNTTFCDMSQKRGAWLVISPPRTQHHVVAESSQTDRNVQGRTARCAHCLAITHHSVGQGFTEDKKSV